MSDAETVRNFYQKHNLPAVFDQLFDQISESAPFPPMSNETSSSVRMDFDAAMIAALAKKYSAAQLEEVSRHLERHGVFPDAFDSWVQSEFIEASTSAMNKSQYLESAVAGINIRTLRPDTVDTQ